MKKLLIILTVMLTTAVLVTVFCGPAIAKVTGRCDNCYTMHNSQNGSSMAYEYYNPDSFNYLDQPQETLLVTSCVGCHSHPSAATYELAGCTVPVVWTRGSEPTNYLAGGNFWWVAQGGAINDPKGHNVLGISGQDANITAAEGAPGNPPGEQKNCQIGGCHGTLAVAQTAVTDLGSGCEGCHLRVRHHADDRTDPVTGGYRVTTDDQGCYRFLVAHSGANHVKSFGVHGIEDGDWQQLPQASESKHNEYIGVDGNNNFYITLSPSNPTVTAFCCGCHGEFHKEQDGSGNWIRHPSDAVIPNTGEYADAFGANGTGTGTYDPNVPVARPSLTSVSDTVAIGTDMVMCLSCHMPHGSKYDDLLRWDYDDMIAGGYPSGNTTGCFACHTEKDT